MTEDQYDSWASAVAQLDVATYKPFPSLASIVLERPGGLKG